MGSQPRIHIVVNPAAGQDTPVLATFNTIFHEQGCDWDISLTKQAGDGAQQARRAAEAGCDVVAAYGGDGTVAEVASGLIGTETPMAILPGGTANVMSVELGIPLPLAQACLVACNPQSIARTVDMGEVNGHHFILRVGVGFEAAMVESADRELKNRLGVLAYLWAAMQSLTQPVISHYQLLIDGKEVETEGVTCLIANSGNLGQADVKLLPMVDIGDGLLDVIVIQQANLKSFFDILGSITGLKQIQSADSIAQPNDLNQQLAQSIQHWQARTVKLVATPAQSTQYDGEVLGKAPVDCRVLPGAVRVLTPPVV